MSKGSAAAAKNQTGVSNAYASSFNKSGIQDRGAVEPFLQGEINDPQGYGQDAVNQMLTQGGESVSGATGAADEKANLLAARTGNTSSLPGIVGANARDAMKQNSDNALTIALKNADLKQHQQQAGASGLENLYGEDTGSVLKSLGLADQSIQDWTGAQTGAQDAAMGWTKTIAGLIPKPPAAGG
jgi:hypothetical protein